MAFLISLSVCAAGETYTSWASLAKQARVAVVTAHALPLSKLHSAQGAKLQEALGCSETFSLQPDKADETMGQGGGDDTANAAHAQSSAQQDCR